MCCGWIVGLVFFYGRSTYVRIVCVFFPRLGSVRFGSCRFVSVRLVRFGVFLFCFARLVWFRFCWFRFVSFHAVSFNSVSCATSTSSVGYTLRQPSRNPLHLRVHVEIHVLIGFDGAKNWTVNLPPSCRFVTFRLVHYNSSV